MVFPSVHSLQRTIREREQEAQRNESKLSLGFPRTNTKQQRAKQTFFPAVCLSIQTRNRPTKHKSNYPSVKIRISLLRSVFAGEGLFFHYIYKKKYKKTIVSTICLLWLRLEATCEWFVDGGKSIGFHLYFLIGSLQQKTHLATRSNCYTHRRSYCALLENFMSPILR